jgi:hypothetical protein
MSSAVSKRLRELRIRVALGAQRMEGVAGRLDVALSVRLVEDPVRNPGDSEFL